MSYISSDTEMGRPHHDHAWRADDGSVHATVRLAEYILGVSLYFDSAADARAVAAACTEAAEAIEAIERIEDGAP